MAHDPEGSTTGRNQAKRRGSLLWRIARIPLVIYVILVLLLMWMEESLVFFPSKFPVGIWTPPGDEVEDVEFAAADGTRLHGWYYPHDKPRALILYAHGNAGNITHRADVMRTLHERAQVGVFMFDYRGYGKSEGSPDERGILEDARAARRWLAEREGVSEKTIVLMGRSLGGGVMVDLAAKDGCRALILESTFTSLPDVAALHYPWFPVKLMMRTRLDAVSKIADYQGPLLQSHGEKDRLIPFPIGQALFEAATTSDKKFISFPRSGHNHSPPPSYYDALAAFIEGLE